MSLRQSNEQVDYMYYLLMVPFSWNMARQQHVRCKSLGGELGGRCHDPDRCCGQYFSSNMSRAVQAEVGFCQVISTSHTDILYYNISNHRNNCKTASICLFLFDSHTRRSALFLARLPTHASPSLFHILTSFVRTSPITMLTNRSCHWPRRGLGVSTL